MSRYIDLAEIATKDAQEFYARRDQCAAVAARLAQELAFYLEAPEGELPSRS